LVKKRNKIRNTHLKLYLPKLETDNTERSYWKNIETETNIKVHGICFL
jgi:hypothetical protein